MTHSFNSDTANIARGERADGKQILQNWFGGHIQAELFEEVVGLGSYGRTLTVLTASDVPDLEEIEKEEELRGSWEPSFKRWRAGKMFDELIRELRRLDGRHEVSISIPSDADGYFDRECPSPECQFEFKVHEDDWRDKVRDEEVCCPFCGHTAASDAWWTQDQLKHTEKVALAHIDHRINRAMKRDADRWNRRQPRNSFISMTMKVDSRPSYLPLPPAAVEPMRLKIACPECECRYAVIGAAFFCPACGHNAADLVFSQTITGIRQVLDALAHINATVPDRDTADTTVRLITENGLQNAVTAFQRFAEALYSGFPSVGSPRRNAFQNLNEGSNLWLSATGKQYGGYLNSTELNALTRFFQQRHLLAHTQGIVDADYINRTGDTNYRIGQRLVVRESAVRDCLTLIEKLATGMASDTASSKEIET